MLDHLRRRCAPLAAACALIGVSCGPPSDARCVAGFTFRQAIGGTAEGDVLVLDAGYGAGWANAAADSRDVAIADVRIVGMLEIVYRPPPVAGSTLVSVGRIHVTADLVDVSPGSAGGSCPVDTVFEVFSDGQGNAAAAEVIAEADRDGGGP
jgi:hypothetical protein